MTPVDDAKRLSLLLEYGVPAEREAIAWADSQIATLDSPPHALLELSTTPPDHTAEILSQLHVLETGSDCWAALRAAIPYLHEHLVSHPADAPRVAAKLFHVVVSADDVPQDFMFAYHFDDAFDLARERVFGDLKSVEAEFINELASFADQGLTNR